MRKLTTATGKTYDVEWASVLPLSQALYINFVGYSMDELYDIFKNPEETKTLTVDDLGDVTTYTDRTRLTGILLSTTDGVVQIHLETPPNA